MISVIIPTLNEEANIEACLASVGSSIEIERIVVDGGSVDSTIEIAKKYGCRVLKTLANRSAQMNIGASKASGSILLFLHADTLLPEDWFENVMTILNEKCVVCGAFSLSISGSLRGGCCVAALANLRSRIFHMPYGDQALFLTKTVFESVGGFPDCLIMEDFEFVLRLKNTGKIYISSLYVKTSDRRWLKLGIIKTTLINQLVIVAYFLGVSHTKLRRFYDKRSKTEKPFWIGII